VNGLSSRINVTEAASTLGIARRAIPVISVKTSDGSRSATTTLASASCSSFTLFIPGFRSLSWRTGIRKPAELDQVSDTATLPVRLQAARGLRLETDWRGLTSTSSAWSVFADLLDPPENPYVRDPVGWVRDRLGEFMWSKQREIAESVVVNRYTAIKSAHDTGKSFTMSRLAAWWLDVHPIGEAFVVTTAPTTAQVEAILWREIGKAHRKGNLPGRITLDAKWYMGQELVAYGRKPADYDQAAFQGIHAKYVLVLLDEAVGIPKSLFDAVDALATNVNARVAAVANPYDPSSHFAQVCKPGSGWVVKRISAFDTPAYTGEKVPEELLPLLVSPEWVEERKIRWGVNSPIYQSKVLGEFPDISDDSLILPRWIEQRRNDHSNATGAPSCPGTSPASVRTRQWACAVKAGGSGCPELTTRPTR
jgi:hypothetical protein